MALRETQLEHGQRLDGIDAKLAEHDRRFDAVDRRLDAVDAKLSDLSSDVASIKVTIGTVAVGMYGLEKLVRRIVPDDGDEANN